MSLASGQGVVVLEETDLLVPGQRPGVGSVKLEKAETVLA
jgi:hypothetical protein